MTTSHSVRVFFPPTEPAPDPLPSALTVLGQTRKALDEANVSPWLAGGDSAKCRRAVRELERAQTAYWRACEAVAMIVNERVNQT